VAAASGRKISIDDRKHNFRLAVRTKLIALTKPRESEKEKIIVVGGSGRL